MRLDIDDALDGDLIRPVLRDEVDEVGADRGKGGGLRDFRGNRNHIVAEDGGFARIALEDCVSGVADGGVDGEDAHGWS